MTEESRWWLTWWLKYLDGGWPKWLKYLDGGWPKWLKYLDGGWSKWLKYLACDWPKWLKYLDGGWPKLLKYLDGGWPKWLRYLDGGWPKWLKYLDGGWTSSTTRRMTWDSTSPPSTRSISRSSRPTWNKSLPRKNSGLVYILRKKRCSGSEMLWYGSMFRSVNQYQYQGMEASTQIISEPVSEGIKSNRKKVY